MYAITHIEISIVRNDGRPGSAGGGPEICVGDLRGGRRTGVGVWAVAFPLYAVKHIGISVVRSNAYRDSVVRISAYGDFPLYAIMHIGISVVRSNGYMDFHCTL